jgi:hypothetical protein
MNVYFGVLISCPCYIFLCCGVVCSWSGWELEGGMIQCDNVMLGMSNMGFLL